eukprot:SAG22_NODE_16_length_32723_cov_26.404825_30_plen_146_part_00
MPYSPVGLDRPGPPAHLRLGSSQTLTRGWSKSGVHSGAGLRRGCDPPAANRAAVLTRRALADFDARARQRAPAPAAGAAQEGGGMARDVDSSDEEEEEHTFKVPTAQDMRGSSMEQQMRRLYDLHQAALSIQAGARGMLSRRRLR